MRQLNRIIHILALGLWFGSNVFFTFVAAVLIFKTWEAYGEAPPDWLSGRAYMTRETGTRIAGATVAPIFPFFFMVQGVCALLALITSVGFSRGEPGRRIHRVRFYVILLAALTVTFGWPLSQMVGELREQRYSADRAVAEPARAEFGRLHAASLFLNFGTVALVATALALGASLPGETAAKKE